MKAAIKAAKNGTPIDLLVQRGSRFQTISVDWKGGLRWPWLERTVPEGTARLDQLMMPLRPMPKAVPAKKK
jgi:hypothetical protein